MQKYNVIAVLVFVGVIIMTHLVSTLGYNWKVNTVSELAAQGYPRKWMMQAGFILFGLILSWGIIQKATSSSIDYWVDIPIGIYGVAILVSGFFCAKPFMDGVPYSIGQANIHSISATVAGIAFSVGILMSAMRATDITTKITHFLFLLFVMGMSAFFGISQENNGLIQKIMYLGSFIWLLKYYN